MQAIRSANVRADAIVLNSALSAYARNRPPLRTPARQCRAICNAGAFRPPRPPSASSRHYIVDDEAQEAVDEDEDDDL